MPGVVYKYNNTNKLYIKYYTYYIVHYASSSDNHYRNCILASIESLVPKAIIGSWYQ